MFPQIRVAGDPFTCGRQYGAAARDRIYRSLLAYRRIFEHYAGWDWDKATAEAARYLEPIEGFDPRYLTELRGIAAGAEVPFLDIVAINARTEVMFAAAAQHGGRLPGAGECTAFVAVPKDGRGVLVGQNWDWKVHALDTVVVLESDQEAGPRYVTVVEAGLLAKAGFNEAGQAVVTNALVCDADRGEPGVPYHVMLRALHEAPSTAAAIATLQGARRASSASYLVGNRDGSAVGVEAMPGDEDALLMSAPDERGVLIHTNHFAHSGFGRVDIGSLLMPDTYQRRQQLDRELSRQDAWEGDTYERLLADHVGAPDSICAHPDLGAVPAEQDVTVFGLVMALDDATMRLADGPPCSNAFRVIDYGNFFGR